MKSNSNFSLWAVMFSMLLIFSASGLIAGECCIQKNTGQCQPCPKGTAQIDKQDMMGVKAELASVKISDNQNSVPITISLTDGSKQTVYLVSGNSDACKSGRQCIPMPDCDPSNCISGASLTSNPAFINKVQESVQSSKLNGTAQMINGKKCGSSAACNPIDCKPGKNCKLGKDCNPEACKTASNCKQSSQSGTVSKTVQHIEFAVVK